MTDTSGALLEAEIAGVAFKFKQPEPGQMALISHHAQILIKDGVTRSQAERALSLIYRSVLSWVQGADDKMAIEDLIADGETSIENILTTILATTRANQEAEAEEAKPVVRRGRPRKRA